MTTPTPTPPAPDSQLQRWWKYGGNVALSSVVVVLLAAAIVYLVQSRSTRIDTTLAGNYSLKPQTLAVTRNLKEKVRLVSLFPRAADPKEPQDYSQPVADLLEEYARKNPNITVDLIDPQTQPAKLDELVQQVTTQYGQELQPYRQFLDAFPAFVKQFKSFAEVESAKVSAFPIDAIADRELAQTILAAQASVSGLNDRLDAASDNIARALKSSPPDYRGAVDRVVLELGLLDQLLARVIDDFRALPPAPATPAAISIYATESLPNFVAAQKLVDSTLASARALGNLKLDALRQSIKRRTVLVMGERDMRVLGFTDLWQAPDDMRAFLMASGSSTDFPKLKFAGEQQISTALVAITQPTKPLAIFVRPGGVPLTQSLFRPAQFSVVARRLRDANFQIVEKDLSGQFVMQAQMQGFPVVEASDEQMRDRSAVWIVFALTQAFGPQGPSPVSGKLAEHLVEGGSALVLTEPGREDLGAALRDWGIAPRTDTLIVKQPPASAASVESADIIDQAEREPYILLTTRFGTHPITTPISGLQGILLAISPVQFAPAPGLTSTPLLPIPRTVSTWADSAIDPVFERVPPVFDPDADIPNTAAAPLYAGVAVESAGPATTQPSRPQRLVVLGSATSFSNGVINIPDPELLKRGMPVSRFPANSELFVNCVLWLSSMDTMLAISPAAMEVSRIGDIPEGQLAFLRWGVLIIGLPALVLIAGVGMYFHRRE